jgi:hypothetical protein
VTRDEELSAAMRVDLERRVGEISRSGAREFGHIGAGEWTAASLAFVILPLVLWWWFR